MSTVTPPISEINAENNAPETSSGSSDQTGRLSDPNRRVLCKPNIIWLAILHVGALAALLPYFFSWQGVVLMFFLHWLTGGIGICLGFHRLLTHTSFKTYGPVRWTIAWLGGLAGEGRPRDQIIHP